jgi:hypothetical protein
MRSHVFLTPMSPDGKPGEVIEAVENEYPAQYLEPLAYHDATTRTSSEVQKEMDALIASLAKLRAGARSKADQLVRILQRELRVVLDREEADRRKLEREKERQRMQVGADSPFARQSVVQSLVDATTALLEASATLPAPRAVKKTKAEIKAGWDKHLADLDAWLAKRALDRVRRDAATPAPSTHSAPICCSGRYLCAACETKRKAKAAAA